MTPNDPPFRNPRCLADSSVEDVRAPLLQMLRGPRAGHVASEIHKTTPCEISSFGTYSMLIVLVFSRLQFGSKLAGGRRAFVFRKLYLKIFELQCSIQNRSSEPLSHQVLG